LDGLNEIPRISYKLKQELSRKLIDYQQSIVSQSKDDTNSELDSALIIESATKPDNSVSADSVAILGRSNDVINPTIDLEELVDVQDQSSSKLSLPVALSQE